MMSNPPTSAPRAGTSPSRALNVTLWIVQILVAAAFLAAGATKLAGIDMQVATFESIGLGQWFRYFTGAVEIAGAVLLLVPRRAFYGAALLAATMVGAIATHLFVIGGSAIPALVLLIATAAAAWFRRPVRAVQ
jgi:hypothetical protein